jgi:hypothetical protein
LNPTSRGPMDIIEVGLEIIWRCCYQLIIHLTSAIGATRDATTTIVAMEGEASGSGEDTALKEAALSGEAVTIRARHFQ